MEDPSMFSGATSNQSGEVSDSNSHVLRSNNGVSASKFKGVVCQQNGHWGAQIYANHQRIWLGTFKSEREAAAAYDTAAIKLRNGDAHRNLPWNEITVQETNFQSHFSTEHVLSMIRDGSYAERFSDYLKSQVPKSMDLNNNVKGIGEVKLRELFRKELTPSDVSKLNRLVIPKKYAVKYFPPISESEENKGGSLDYTELVFYDHSMRVWKFRYCYWKSSQSFVFTRGWNRFAKERGLKPKDRVIFSVYDYGLMGMQKVYAIDVGYNKDGEMVDNVTSDGTRLELAIGQPTVLNACENIKEHVPDFSTNVEKKGFKLFGVQIN